jgi:aminoglycoside/choline kinase family phosphotransferase
MMVQGEAYLIDFQGMREGSAFYDLGSLLYDPYVPFTPEQRLELLRYYYDLDGSSSLPWRTFQARFHEGAVQRLMQALGAYGFLGLKRGKETFLGHIPAGLANLREAARAAGTLKSLENLADRCEEKTRDLPGLVAVAG